MTNTGIKRSSQVYYTLLDNSHQNRIDDLGFSVLHFLQQTGNALGDVKGVDDAGLPVQRDQDSHHLE